MIDSRLAGDLRARLGALSIDWANAYAGPEPDGATCAYPEAAARAAGLRSLGPRADVTACSALEPMRREPSHQSESISEVRSGEWLVLLRQEGDWWLVASEDEYVGWVHSWTLRTQEPGERDALRGRLLGRFAGPRDTLWNSDHWASGPVWRGTPLLVPEEGERRRSGQVLVVLPHGASGWLPEEQIEAPASLASKVSMLTTARELLGTPYRWGGRSPGGFDCSGYVQLAALLAGFALPRDARQQAECGEAVEPDPSAWRAGDLLFFGEPADHVGFFDGRDGLIHCSGFARWQKLGDTPQLMSRLTHVRRVGFPDAVRRSSLWQHPVTGLDSSS